MKTNERRQRHYKSPREKHMKRAIILAMPCLFSLECSPDSRLSSTDEHSRSTVSSASHELSGDEEVQSWCGWDMLRPSVYLEGNVEGIDFSEGAFGDDDWSLIVRPDPNYEAYLDNSFWQRNRDGRIECEVQPPDVVLGQHYNTRAAMERYFGPLQNQHVQINGAWSQEALFCHDNKTEIHSLISALWTNASVEPPYNSLSYRLKFLVFSNSSNYHIIVRPHMPPRNREDVFGLFQVRFPETPSGIDPSRMLQYEMLNETNAARQRQFNVTVDRQLAGIVESGTSDTGQGFYFAEMEIGPAAAFISQSVPTTMAPGQSYDVSITMRNLEGGVGAWLPANWYRLGAENPRDNTIWGMSRVPLPRTVVIFDDVTFNFRVTAPIVPGIYNFQWRMVQDGVRWLGNYTPNVAVTVGGCNATTCPNGCCDGAFCRTSSSSTCGIGGVACVACGANEQCVNGQCLCTPQCNPSQCGTSDGCGHECYTCSGTCCEGTCCPSGYLCCAGTCVNGDQCW